MKYLSVRNRFIRHLPTFPLIFLAIFPILLLDVWVEVYHRVCFPFYNLEYIKRGKYIKTDRHKLKYLNLMQRYNCFYCGYANGVVHYWSKIFAETEKYWCGIQHEKDENFIVPEHHADFIPYNNEAAFENAYNKNRTRRI